LAENVKALTIENAAGPIPRLIYSIMPCLETSVEGPIGYSIYNTMASPENAES
jgi:hypothetical protein